MTQVGSGWAAWTAIIALVAPSGCTAASHERLSVEQGVVLAADRVPLAYDMRGEGQPAVLLVHGLRCDRALWRWTAEDLAKDHCVVCVDLAGHGDSGATRTNWGIAALGADVQAIVEALKLPRVVLVGHSIGGLVCLDAARRMPGRVSAVVGVDTLQNAEFRMPQERAKAIADAMDADPSRGLREMLPQMLGPTADPAILEWLVVHGLRADNRAASGLFHSLVAADIGALLRCARVPVRCVNAAPGAAPASVPTDIATNRKYADFDAVLIDGVGHFPMVERPFTFAERLRGLLATMR